MNAPTTPSLLRSLRAVVPHRDTTFDEALQVAELQATKLLELLRQDSVSESDFAAMPRLRIVREGGLLVSGMSHWSGTHWIITLNAADSLARQRFTLLHEFKHILDHGQTTTLYASRHRKSPSERAELAADYFAGCALVPKRQLKAAWGNGIQALDELAEHFAVSEPAIAVRLSQTGLDAPFDPLPAARCARPVRTPFAQAQRFRVARRPPTRRIYA